DAIVRWEGHRFSGESSSPPGRVPIANPGGDTLRIAPPPAPPPTPPPAPASHDAQYERGRVLRAARRRAAATAARRRAEVRGRSRAQDALHEVPQVRLRLDY